MDNIRGGIDIFYNETKLAALNSNFILLRIDGYSNGVKTDNVQYQISATHPGSMGGRHKLQKPWFFRSCGIINVLYVGIEYSPHSKISFENHVDIFLEPSRIIHIPLLLIVTAGPTNDQRSHQQSVKHQTHDFRDVLRVLQQKIEDGVVKPQNVTSKHREKECKKITATSYPVCESVFRICFPSEQRFETIRRGELDLTKCSETSNATLLYHLRVIEVAAWDFFWDAVRNVRSAYVDGLDTSDVQDCHVSDTRHFLDVMITGGGPPLFAACMATLAYRHLRRHHHESYVIDELVENVRKANSVTAHYSATSKCHSSMFYHVHAGTPDKNTNVLVLYDLHRDSPRAHIDGFDVSQGSVRSALSNVEPHVKALASFLGFY